MSSKMSKRKRSKYVSPYHPSTFMMDLWQRTFNYCFHAPRNNQELINKRVMAPRKPKKKPKAFVVEEEI